MLIKRKDSTAFIFFLIIFLNPSQVLYNIPLKPPGGFVMETGAGHVKYIYKKYNNMPVPYGQNGIILIDYKHSITSKLLIDFGKYGKAIVPESAIKRL